MGEDGSLFISTEIVSGSMSLELFRATPALYFGGRFTGRGQNQVTLFKITSYNQGFSGEPGLTSPRNATNAAKPTTRLC